MCHSLLSKARSQHSSFHFDSIFLYSKRVAEVKSPLLLFIENNIELEQNLLHGKSFNEAINTKPNSQT